MSLQEGNLDTNTGEESHCKDRGKEWSYESTNQETPRFASNYQKLEERHGINSLSEIMGGNNTADA